MSVWQCQRVIEVADGIIVFTRGGELQIFAPAHALADLAV
jgi:hypothetical protein